MISQKLKLVIALAIVGSAIKVIDNINKKKRRKLWVRKWIERRDTKETTLSLVHNELKFEDIPSYRNFLRMDKDCFKELLFLVTPLVSKQDTHLRKSISAQDRLTVTLRFLATGDSYKSLEYSTRIPACTIAKIVPECCTAIYSVLKKKYLKVPRTETEWETVASNFYMHWNFPNCLGALDGKHINFEAPTSAGSIYWNYKHSNSIVLLALVDSEYKFLYIDVGVNGRVSDGGVFRESNLNHALQNNSINIPKDSPLPNTNIPLPFVIVADAAFPLQRHIMKPFPFRNLTSIQRIYNYRHSRARRVSENAFGILVSRFRVLLSTIKLCPKKVEGIALACCVLHNFLLIKSNSYASIESVDREDEHGNLIPGSWRNTSSDLCSIQNIHRRPTTTALSVREQYMNYFNTVGKVPWQDQYA